MIDHDHRLAGRRVVYRGYGGYPEEGTITSVNEEARIAFVRYGISSTSQSTLIDDRLTFLDGTPVSEELTDG